MAETSRLARVTARLGIFGIVLFIVGPLMAHFGLVAPLAGFIAFALAGLLCVVTMILGIIAVLRGTAQSRRIVWPGLIPAVIALVVFIGAASRGRGVPRINDITTDTQSPPQFVSAVKLPANVGRDLTYPGTSFAEQQRAGYPDLAPLHLDVSPDDAYTRVRTAASQMPTWTITRDDGNVRVIEGVDTSWLFRFQDDFIIEVRPDNSGSVVQMRSKSRVGQGDLGANAARIKAFFARCGAAR